MSYLAAENRYDAMSYRRCGRSGILLPAISLGLWHNFGSLTPFDVQKSILRTAFDNGITHFDLANNYGPPYGEAERNFGDHMRNDWRPYRDELLISTKAGWDMWPGPYGDHGSRKYLIASIDQSLKRMGLEYVDIFYHHRPDPDTPLEETMGALDQIVRSGKALYVGISNYPAPLAREAFRILKELGTPCLIHQPSYSMINRWIEDGLTEVLREEQVGCICFAPLHHGMLTGKYLGGIPEGSRGARGFFAPDQLAAQQKKIEALGEIARERGQSLAQMSLSWVLRDDVVTSALIGASRPEQVLENIQAVHAAPFTREELDRIDAITKEE